MPEKLYPVLERRRLLRDGLRVSAALGGAAFLAA